MITPDDLKLDVLKHTDFEQLEREIDESIKQHHNQYKWEYACLNKELPLEVRNELTRRYKKGGWTYVYHTTTSECHERAGLTSFLLSIKPIEEKYLNHYKTCSINEPIYQEMQPEITYTLPIANGKLTIDISKEDNYPGLDIEFISDDIREDIVKPRILIEAPIDGETKYQSNLRALIWAGAYSEDYTDSVVFTMQQLGRDKRIKLSFSDEIGCTEFYVYEHWLKLQSTDDNEKLYHMAAENTDISGLVS